MEGTSICMGLLACTTLATARSSSAGAAEFPYILLRPLIRKGNRRQNPFSKRRVFSLNGSRSSPTAKNKLRLDDADNLDYEYIRFHLDDIAAILEMPDLYTTIDGLLREHRKGRRRRE